MIVDYPNILVVHGSFGMLDYHTGMYLIQKTSKIVRSVTPSLMSLKMTLINMSLCIPGRLINLVQSALYKIFVVMYTR